MSKRASRTNKSPTPGADRPVADRPLTLALPRGRLLDEAIELFWRAGVDLGPVAEARSTRRLIVPVPREGLQVLIVRDTDVPAYVE